MALLCPSLLAPQGTDVAVGTDLGWARGVPHPLEMLLLAESGGDALGQEAPSLLGSLHAASHIPWTPPGLLSNILEAPGVSPPRIDPFSLWS